MFQWEVGWADIAIGVLGSARSGSGAAGSNVWAIPTDIIQPLVTSSHC